ncbi:hypothetical protein SESBI_38255, partial [Sesbania bispinosa]
VGYYVILATVVAMVGNKDWHHLYSSVKPKDNERSEFGVSSYDGIMLKLMSLMVELRGFYLNDYHVLNYLTKHASQSIGVHDPFECMIGTEFLFIVNKTCDHKVDQDGCFKISMLTALKKVCPIDDSFLKSDKAKSSSSVRSDGVLIATDVATTSSSVGLTETSIARSFDCEFCDSEYMTGLPKK